MCRAALGCEVIAAEPAIAGANSRVFRVDLRGAAPSRVIVKFYRHDPGDLRDRLTTEFEALEFLWQNGVRSIPRPIAIGGDRQCGIYEYLDGERPDPAAIGTADIDVSVDFLGTLGRLRAARGSERVGAASEACFSLGAIVDSVDGRLDRLCAGPLEGEEVRQLRAWIDGTFVPFRTAAVEWSRGEAARAGIAYDVPIPPDARTISPSDFGFHNAIRRPGGTLAFVDFEYFGWDDPAKTIVDFLLHPAMPLGDALRRRFAARALAAFGDVPRLAERARIVYPLFGLKWTMILLNDFLAERFAQATAGRRMLQLGKAQALIERLASQYTTNPYVS
jgi:phosphotransferase family enzyme